MSGLFITLEGTDGSGKTTQINRLKEYFSEKGYRVVCTREPGGTPIGEKIREIIIDKNNSEMANITEALLYAAARAQLVNEVIEPVLKDGGVVISDRFLDSSLVYQGFARGMGENFIKNINRAGVNSLEPDITFLLKLKPEDSIARKSKQAELDRLEAEKANFHQRVFDGYISLARRNKERIKIIDALKTEEDIHNEILNHIEGFMKKRGF
ncbi:MAG: dTMP kinase [Clostridia bacterium]|jgi:dTMP kinase|nr:dTMP kinase [Clostridia bacterium]